MANKKINELQSRVPSLTDLMLVGDPSSGYSYKCTVHDIANIIEGDIGDTYVTLATTQTISGAKTFSNNLTLTSVTNASVDTDKFLVLNASNIVNFRTGSEVLSDIGGQGTISLTTSGTSGAATFSSNTLNIPQYQGALTLTTTGTSGAATLAGNTLNIPNYAPDLSGYVPTSRTITINGTTQDLSANRTYNVGTVTSVAASAGTGISISGSPITSSGTITITNTAPDQIVALTAGTGISVSGTYPNFTITNLSPSLGGTVTSVALSAPTGFSVTGSPVTTSGTLGLTFASGYSLPTTASQVNWDSAYNNMIVSAAVTGTTTKTLTLTQQDAGTITASWTDNNTDAVTSVFGRTGAVVAVSGDYTTAQVTESGNLYYTDARARAALSAGTGISYSSTTGVISSTITQYTDALARAAISLTTTGSSGAATYSSSTGVLNVPTYTLTGLGGVPTTRTITINGTAQDLSTDRTFSVGTVTSVAATAGTGISISGSPITSSGTLTITNTAPDQVVALTAGTGISTSGTYPNFTITNSAPDQTVALTAGSNITITGTYPNFTIAASGGGGSVSGTTNRIAKFTSSTAVGDSSIEDLASSVAMTISSGGNVSLTSSITATQGIFRNFSVGAIQAIRDLDVTSVGAAGQRIEIGALNGTTPTAGAAIDGVLENPATTGYLVFNTRTASSLTEKMRLDTRGNLGLGVTPSAWNAAYKVFEVNNAALVANTSNYNWLGNNWYVSVAGNNTYKSNGAALLYEQGLGQHVWFTAPSGTANTNITFVQAMTLNASNNLGLGTATIGSRLQVNGNAAIGYSASTAAPTNGLAVAGNTYMGGSTTLVTSDGVLPQSVNLQLFNGGAASNNADKYADLILANNMSFTDGAVGRILGVNSAITTTDKRLAQISLILDAAINSGAINFLTLNSGTLSEKFRIAANGTIFVGNGPTAATPVLGIISGTGGTGSNVAGAEFRIRGGASTGSGAGGPITFYTSAAGSAGTGVNAATEAMRITSGGLVGIGTTAPDARLRVAGVTNGLQAIFTNVDGRGLAISTSLVAGTNDAGSILNARGATSGTMIFQTDGTERARITSGGNVGIGTTSPIEKLQVNGNIYVASGEVYGATSYSDAAVNKGMSFSGTNLLLNNGGERMRITSGGQVTLSTGANVSAIAQTGYSLTGSNAQSLIDLAGTWNTTGNPTAIKLNITNTASGTGADLMELQVGGTNQFRVTKGGAIETDNPTTGTKKPWKLGSVMASSMAYDATRYVEVEIDGTLYYLALSTLA